MYLSVHTAMFTGFLYFGVMYLAVHTAMFTVFLCFGVMYDVVDVHASMCFFFIVFC